MAWQNSAAMVANGGGPSNGGEVGNGQPQGTEYTLQGKLIASGSSAGVQSIGHSSGAILVRNAP